VLFTSRNICCCLDTNEGQKQLTFDTFSAYYFLSEKKRTHTTSLLTDSLVCHTEDTQADTSLNYVRLPFPQQPHVLFGFIYIQDGKQVIGRQKTIFPKKK